MFVLNQATDKELESALLEYFPLYKQLQKIVEVFHKEGDSVGITSFGLDQGHITINYSSWGTCEYGGEGKLTVPLSMLRLSEENLEAERLIMEQKEQQRKAEQKAAEEKAQRHAEYLKLKQEFEPDGTTH